MCRCPGWLQGPATCRWPENSYPVTTMSLVLSKNVVASCMSCQDKACPLKEEHTHYTLHIEVTVAGWAVVRRPLSLAGGLMEQPHAGSSDARIRSDWREQHSGWSIGLFKLHTVQTCLQAGPGHSICVRPAPFSAEQSSLLQTVQQGHLLDGEQHCS